MRLTGLTISVMVLAFAGACSDREAAGGDARPDRSLQPDSQVVHDRSASDGGGSPEKRPVDLSADDAGDAVYLDLPAFPDLPPSTCSVPQTPTAGTTGPAGKTDILFVVDNSIGMQSLQSALLSAIVTLESALAAASSSLDFRIGVVTTDLGISPFSVSSCTGCGDDGQLQTQPQLSSCQAPASKYLENNKGVTNYTGTLANAFKCLASVGSTGCGFEQPLESAAIQLTSSTTFLRPDASLVLVVFTNEDDCSAQNKNLFDPNQASLGPLASFRCFRFGITCDINDPTKPGPRTGCTPIVGGLLRDVSLFSSLLKSLKPQNRVGVVVIAGDATPVSVLVSGSSSSLDTSCSTSQGTGYPGIRLKALADAFGSTHGKFHSICGSLTQAMQDIATLAQTL